MSGRPGRRPRGVKDKVRKVVGYVRCSTEEQATRGVTLQAQRAKIVAFCEATDRTLDEVIVDAGQSAKSTQRPGFLRVIDAVRAGEISAVVVVKIDRATRSVRDLADVMELFAAMNCAFISVTESIDTGSAAGRMITNLLGVLAQFEREQLGERTSFALKHKRQNLKVYGHPPFGWARVGDILKPVPDEQNALKRLRVMDAEGISYRRIAEWLTTSGFRPRQGAKIWHAASVRKMLLSKMNAENSDD